MAHLLMTLVSGKGYRSDIDGLRAVAVLAVILFHFGCLPHGFLGVDVFFVISGFLITGIIYSEVGHNRFSIRSFYLRRTRRIIPLALFISMVALAVGVATMLPGDLNSLAESVVATNIFGNNILQAITTKNYWDVVNAYKPLMHTWSLGVEEQYYLLYPLLFSVVGKHRLAWLLPIISGLAAVSLVLYLLPFADFQKFYEIYFRFWELAAGGIAAIVLGRKRIDTRYAIVPIVGLALVFCLGGPATPEMTVLITVLLTLGVLVSSSDRGALSTRILENRLLVAIGKISFSLYMWHQLLLAFTRYFVVDELRPQHLIAIFALTVVLSIGSYVAIEQPFRNKQKVETRRLLFAVGFVFVLTTGSSLYIYQHAGVVRDVPELGITTSDGERDLHIKYNMRVFAYDADFRSADKVKVLVIGNSFARDWANVLLESRYSNTIELSYIAEPKSHQDLRARATAADVVFYSTPDRPEVHRLGIPEDKVWAIGTKNFGRSNGIVYNHRGANYFSQRAAMERGYVESNATMRQTWGDRYIDLIGRVIDDHQMVPVFTPHHRFISQDGRHFTKDGAQYFAELFDADLMAILGRAAGGKAAG